MRKTSLVLLSTLLMACGKPQETEKVLPAAPVYTAPAVTASVHPAAPTAPISPYLCQINEANREKSHRSPVVSSPARKDSSFRAAPAPRNHRENEVRDGILTIYFPTNSWTLNDNDYSDLRTFIRNLAPGTNLILEGYADLRGSEEFNLELGRKRASGIEELLHANPRLGRVESVSYGESKPVNSGNDFASLQANRRVRVVPNKTVIARGFDLLSSDYYLVDQTGSMEQLISKGLRKWDEVQRYKFPEAAHLYTFSSQPLPCSGDLRTTRPQGETPLFAAAYDLISDMPSGKSLTVLTDGCNNYGKTHPAQVIDLAKRKNISVSFIALDPCNRADLENIAGNTGGRTYIPYK